MFQQSVTQFQPEAWQLDDLYKELAVADVEEAFARFEKDLADFCMPIANC